jgi:hypothetical protein
VLQTGDAGEQPATSLPDVVKDLADLRFSWGGLYRITWQGQFRATHIASGEILGAESAAAMRVLMLTHSG